jgi:iron complex outermembrane recepter protein
MRSPLKLLGRPVQRALLLAGTVLLLPCASATAQSGDAVASGKSSDDSAAELGVIVVTAQSRTQEVQDVPIAIQVVTSVQIDKLAATDLSKMSGYIPGLVVSGEQPTQPNYSLRGINDTGFGIGTDSPIGTYEDGVYTGKSGGALLIFNDIQRVEVIKGPQGTLFGRNSAGGAISVVTNTPGRDFEAQARVRAGNFGQRYVDGVLNIPMGSDFAFRLSAADNQSRGWLRDAATGQYYEKNDDWGARAQLRWNAPGSTVVNLSFEYERLNQPPRPAIGLLDLPPAPAVPPPPGDPNTYLDPRTAPLYDGVIGGRETRNFNALTLRVEHPLPFGDLTSITAYRHFSTYNREDQTGTNRLNLYFDDVNIERNSSWSQEFKLSGKSALADWVGGLSYYYDDAHQTSQLNLFTDSIDTLIQNTQGFSLYGAVTQALQANGLPFTLLGDPWQENMINRNISKSYAAYGDVIWHLTDRLNLTTGVRITRDRRDFSWYNPMRTATALDATLATLQSLGVLDALGVPIQTFQQNINFNTPISEAAPLRASNTWTDTSPRAVLDYKLTPDVMIYASATRGYQAGGYNFNIPGSHYEPETVWSYESGIKSYFPDYRLLVDASAYYYKFSNLQTLNLVSNGNGGLPAYLVTISDQSAKGVDLEAHWQATGALRLNVAAAYIDSTYKDYIASDGVNLAGQPTGEPLWSTAAGIDYVVHQVAGGSLDFTLQDAYRGKYRCNADSVVQGNCLVTPTFRLGAAQNRTDLRIGWSSPSAPWSVALFANNLFDKRYVTGIGNISATTLGTPFAGISPPRLWGVEAAAHF